MKTRNARANINGTSVPFIKSIKLFRKEETFEKFVLGFVPCAKTRKGSAHKLSPVVTL